MVNGKIANPNLPFRMSISTEQSTALAGAMQVFSGMSERDFALSSGYWQVKPYAKGEYFNRKGNICTHLGFIAQGVFRSFTVDGKTGEEKNVFFYSTHGFVVTFKSFVNQIPCDYQTQAMTESLVIYINYQDLIQLYQKSHAWEKFGRLVAQEAFNITMTRIEGFLLKSPEERYLDLVQAHPDIFNSIPLYHISSYLGIQGPSLSRIRKRLLDR